MFRFFRTGRRPRVVAVTGASAGVGRAIAWEFAHMGSAVGLLARDHERLEEVAKEVERLGGRALPLPVDVSDAAQVEAAAAVIEERLGPIDVWVNNAMVSVFSPVKQMQAEEYRRVTEVTYLGYVHGTLAALRRMLPRDCGTIVQVGSALAYRAIPLQSAYCAAKHAIEGFTESLRCELIHDGSHVRVTQVNLPATNTPQFDWSRSRMPRRAQPVPPIYQPEVAARAVAYAARHPRRQLNVGMPTLVAVFGNKLAPALGDLYLAKTGYESQQTREPEDRLRPDNLFAPVPGPFGAHGRFDARSRGRSLQVWLNLHRGLVAAAASLAVGSAVFGLSALKRKAALPS